MSLIYSSTNDLKKSSSFKKVFFYNNTIGVYECHMTSRFAQIDCRSQHCLGFTSPGDRQGCTPIPTWAPVMGNPYTSPISRGYSGQISIIPKPEFFGDFGEIPLQSPPFGVTKEVAIICPGLIQVSAHPLSNPRCL